MKVGQSAPKFTAQNRTGDNISLQDFHDQWLVLYFYPKDHTPGCTAEAIEFTEKLAEFQALNAQTATAAEVKLAVTQANGQRRTTLVPPLLDAWAAYQVMVKARA